MFTTNTATTLDLITGKDLPDCNRNVLQLICVPELTVSSNQHIVYPDFGAAFDTPNKCHNDMCPLKLWWMTEFKTKHLICFRKKKKPPAKVEHQDIKGIKCVCLPDFGRFVGSRCVSSVSHYGPQPSKSHYPFVIVSLAIVCPETHSSG